MDGLLAEAANLRAVGIVVGEHGLQGTLKVAPLCDFPERFEALRTVFFTRGDAAPVKHQVKRTRWSAGCVLLSICEITDREQARQLRGMEVCVTDAETWKLPADVYYISDLLGFRGITADGAEIGVLTAVYPGSQDILGFDRDGTELLVPFVGHWVGRVDTQARTIEILNWQRLAEPETVESDRTPDDH